MFVEWVSGNLRISVLCGVTRCNIFDFDILKLCCIIKRLGTPVLNYIVMITVLCSPGLELTFCSPL